MVRLCFKIWGPVRNAAEMGLSLFSGDLDNKPRRRLPPECVAARSNQPPASLPPLLFLLLSLFPSGAYCC